MNTHTTYTIEQVKTAAATRDAAYAAHTTALARLRGSCAVAEAVGAPPRTLILRDAGSASAQSASRAGRKSALLCRTENKQPPPPSRRRVGAAACAGVRW